MGLKSSTEVRGSFRRMKSLVSWDSIELQLFPQKQEVSGHGWFIIEATMNEFPGSLMILPAVAQFLTENTKFSLTVTGKRIIYKMYL